MPALYSAIVWLFRTFLAEKFVGWVLKGITFGKMVFINTALFALVIAYGWAAFRLIMFVYEKTNQFISFLSDISSGGSNEILAWAMDIIRALGVWNAFVDVYNVFSVPIVSVILLYVYKIGFKVLHSMQLTLTTFNIARL